MSGRSFVRTVKELSRQLLYKAGVRRKLDHLAPAGRAERFAKIYADGVWKRGDDSVPASGDGSSLAATATIRDQLPGLLAQLDCQTLLDIGCGDFTWMRDVPLGSIDYIGLDIVPSVIDEDARLFASATRTFDVADATRDALPDADVILCREVLFHLSFDDIFSALSNMLATPRRYLILTTDDQTGFNSDIESGDFRILNLARRPFKFPPPAFAIEDAGAIAGRKLSVWKAADIGQAIAGRRVHTQSDPV